MYMVAIEPIFKRKHQNHHDQETLKKAQNKSQEKKSFSSCLRGQFFRGPPAEAVSWNPNVFMHKIEHSLIAVEWRLGLQ